MQSTRVMDESLVRKKVRSFIVANFLFGVEDSKLTDGGSFLQTGIIDSTGILEVVTFVESEYGIRVDDIEMVPENLDSLNNISVFVADKLSG